MKYAEYLVVESFGERLKKALEIRDMRPYELAQATGLSKSTISHYLAGRFEPKQVRLGLIAETLRVRPEWLMGLDVPMQTKEFLDHQRDERFKNYLLRLLALDEADREFIFKQIEILERAKNES